MSIPHKFLNEPFSNGFFTESAIFKNNSYKPEVLFLGTFNPKTDNKNNPADFFYGRNWFWPILFNVFNYRTNFYQSRRDNNNLEPSLDDILSLCMKLKLTFTDLIKSVFSNNNYALVGNQATYNNIIFDLFKDDDLCRLSNLGQVEWNIEPIIEFLNTTNTIHTVYLSKKKDNKCFVQKYLDIQQKTRQDIDFRFLHTPSGRGLPGSPLGVFLAMQWIIEQGNHGLKLNWLHEKEVNMFHYNEYTINF